jgi:deferrochelatase/peroxidase EfeB
MALLDLADIQGGILRAYGRLGFPKGRAFFLTVTNAAQGRRLVERLRPRVTTAARWVNPKRGTPLLRTRRPKLTDVIRAEDVPDYPGEVQLVKPKVAINIGFSFLGLQALHVPTRTLRVMPDEFMDGMEARAPMLGDSPFLEQRDTIWREAKARPVHIMVLMNAEMDDAGQPVPELEAETAWLRALCAESEGGVAILPGHGPANLDYQDMSAVLRDQDGKKVPSNREHFGLADGFGEPVFAGQYGPRAEAIKRVGGGKLLAGGGWGPLATGEFLLGYPDEAQEIPGAAMPIEFSRNGTFMAFRKLHENVGRFEGWLDAQGAEMAAAAGLSADDARATVAAKLIGRWPDGVPLAAAPDAAAWQAFNAQLAAAKAAKDETALKQIAAQFVSFTFEGDAAGAACPITTHMRRVNPRATLGPVPGSGSALVNRRRILRRGLPYGAVDPAKPDDAGEHGIIFLAVCSSLFRQFEFVQQQWVQYGLDFDVGSDTCPIVGNHGQTGQAPANYVIPVDPAGTASPFVCKGVPQFVEPRGGEYLFIPSMSALRLIGMGIVDPT